MKKFLTILLFSLLFCNIGFAETYYFKKCKLSNAVLGDYVIDISKKVIKVTLTTVDGTVQNFSDKIKIIGKDQIISEKIESGKGDKIYFEYYLNAKSKTVTKLQYKKESGIDMDLFKLQLKKTNDCSDVKASWNKDKIKKAEISKETKQILEAQEKIKKEQSSIIKCEGNNYKLWTNCKGSYKAETGHKYKGIFKFGKILKGVALFPGGAKYIGEFKDFKPHGYGNFTWSNGDKYFGEWKNGESHGNGTKIWKDGREYSGTFENDKLHGAGTFYYPDGKKYVGEFLNGKRHGEGTFTYPDGTTFIGKFVAGKQEGLGECINLDGTSIPCTSKTDVQTQNFSGKDTRSISIVAKKWIRISQYETNTKKGKKVMDKLKKDFEAKALKLCAPKGNYNVLKKNIEVLDLDETPAYGLETKLQIGINGIVECM
jgi:hypothetical protein